MKKIEPVPGSSLALHREARHPKRGRHLHDIDGTVYDPDTGLPVTREMQDQTGETAAREVSARGLARFKRDFESLSNAIMEKKD